MKTLTFNYKTRPNSSVRYIAIKQTGYKTINFKKKWPSLYGESHCNLGYQA